MDPKEEKKKKQDSDPSLVDKKIQKLQICPLEPWKIQNCPLMG